MLAFIDLVSINNLSQVSKINSQSNGLDWVMLALILKEDKISFYIYYIIYIAIINQ